MVCPRCFNSDVPIFNERYRTLQAAFDTVKIDSTANHSPLHALYFQSMPSQKCISLTQCKERCHELASDFNKKID